MKLVYCPHCQDVFKMQFTFKACMCGKSGGVYESDGLHAWVGGEAKALGFDNSSLAQALIHRPERGMGERFDAFVIPKQCPTVHEIEDTASMCIECELHPSIPGEEICDECALDRMYIQRSIDMYE